MKTKSIATILEEGASLPCYASLEAAGADVYACIKNEIILHPGESKLIPTGLRIAIPKGYEVQVRSRSGLALKHGVIVLNSPGTIDSDYRGEVGVVLINHGKKRFVVEKGMRIAQLVLSPVVQAQFVCAQELSTTLRGEGGFGHTGAH